MLEQPNDAEYETYEILQIFFNKSNFLIHFSVDKFFYINVDVSKQKKFEKMIFHVRYDFDSEKNASLERKNIQPIMFFSKQLSEAEKKYWPTELKIADVV